MPSKRKTTVTKEEAKPALVPKLRFPEFRDPGTWQRMPLGLMLSEHGQKSDGEADVHSVSLTHGVVSQLEHMGRSYAAADTSHYSLVRPFDVVYTRSPLAIYRLGIVKQHRGPKNAIISPLYGVFEPANRHIGYIVEAYFDSPSRSISYLDPLAQKGAKNTIQLSNERFLSGEIVLPTDEAEQQKIAECLSSLDELIGAQGRKLDALKTYKKGLMQQLFPREGETQTRLRFPEFQNAGEWQTLPLVALADKIMVGIASAATHAYREAGVPMLRNQNIKEGKIDDSSLLFIDPAYEAAHKNKRLRSGDVITVRTGYPGLSAVVPERYNNAQCFTSLITRPKKSVLDADYLSAFINSEIGKRFILGAEAGGAQKNVNAGALEALPVYLPEIPEQHRIAKCLSSLDALIAAETQKHAALQRHKRGLLQQLFPSPEEVEA